MVILRPTSKLKKVLPVERTPGESSDTALGDWYINRIVIDRRPLLIIVSSTSLLPILVPARNVRGLPYDIAEIVDARLRRQGVASFIVDAERKAMTPVVIGRTLDRSVLGIMVDFAKAVPYYIDREQWDDEFLWLVEDKLAETPCHARRRFEEVVFPKTKAHELLSAKWAAG